MSPASPSPPLDARLIVYLVSQGDMTAHDAAIELYQRQHNADVIANRAFNLRNRNLLRGIATAQTQLGRAGRGYKACGEPQREQ
jgi:hypothetical protein